MHMPGVLGSAQQVAADIFPLNGRSLGAAVSITLSAPPCPLRQHALGQQLLLRLGRWVEKLGHGLGVCFLQL